MNLSEAIRTVNESSARLNIAVGLLQDAWHRLDDDSGGFPGGHEGGTAPCSECGGEATINGRSCEACDGTGREGTSTQPERMHLTADQAYNDIRALRQALRDNLRTSTTIYDIASRWGVRRIEVEGQLPVEWCASCYRDSRHCEPAAQARYKGLCRFCGDWRAAHKAIPPLKIIEARHRGLRITSVMVQRALAEQRAEQAQQKAQRKQKKKAS